MKAYFKKNWAWLLLVLAFGLFTGIYDKRIIGERNDLKKRVESLEEDIQTAQNKLCNEQAKIEGLTAQELFDLVVFVEKSPDFVGRKDVLDDLQKLSNQILESEVRALGINVRTLQEQLDLTRDALISRAEHRWQILKNIQRK